MSGQVEEIYRFVRQMTRQYFTLKQLLKETEMDLFKELNDGFRNPQSSNGC